ncbi:MULTISPECIES: PAS domain-containing sensor histidine kinase [unclassified Pseudodesulfovibrio]|uniref:sensor histidine kinase n=1 Tax=unclassified Pseudodesulfovibrio TaxID=2661612 RepID=UPI000FEC186B|nr:MULTISPECIES: PAS domain-containing sensor histidine kinase [unclassified Pseudodesulfovibrio]MCJ2163274.1 ATP-binding protein [Pseudodesulfovibrio sp. S3-i]RWU07255.1 two-component sensor histidine kinase [Pseudodesulfovibrio sp. S3]
MHLEKKSPYEKLSRNIALTVITVSIAPLILLGSVIFDQFRSIYREKVYAHLAEVVDKHAHNINTFLQDKLAEVQYVSRTFTFDQLSSPVFLDKTLKKMQQQYGRIFVDLGVVDEEGVQVAYAGPFNLLGADYSKAEWFLNSQGANAGISDVFEGLRQSPHFIISINNGPLGSRWTLRATIDFLAFSYLVQNIRIGETGFAYIRNSRGVYQTRPKDEVNQDLELTPHRELKHEVSLVGVSIYESIDDAGDRYVTVSAPIKGGEWELVYQQKTSDVFSAMNRTELVTLAIFLLGGLGIVVMAVVISRKLVVRCQIADQESEMMTRQMVETGKLAAIGELAAGIAHEINNPVAIMIEEAGWVSDLLEDEGSDMPSSNEINRALAQVANQGRRCKDITHKLLSFARQTDPRVTAVALQPLIREVVDLSMQQARFAQVDFSLKLAENIPSIRASATELQQVLLNLITNAIQAMEPEGGILTISCGMKEDHAVIKVADTGPGIPAANLNRIFDPFFTTKPVGKGSGLGLSICYGIIHQMGGEIDVESTVGKGTRFTLRLPLSLAPKQRENQQENHHD